LDATDLADKEGVRFEVGSGEHLFIKQVSATLTVMKI
jgi:hypothetical protein